VIEIKDTVLIIARGPSVLDVDLAALSKADATSIVINGAIYGVPWADYLFTLDCKNLKKRFDCVNSKAKKVAAIPPGFAHKRPVNTQFLRRIKWQPEIKPGCIRTGNSALGANEMAIQAGAKRVFLFGVDLTGDSGAWVGGAISQGKSHFETAVRWKTLPLIETYNVSINSRLERYPRIGWAECRRMLNV
jgi:hypothetical protein